MSWPHCEQNRVLSLTYAPHFGQFIAFILPLSVPRKIDWRAGLLRLAGWSE
jgi:hypothetical protein